VVGTVAFAPPGAANNTGDDPCLILKVYQCVDVRMRMGGNARVMLEAHFSRDRAIARWRELLDRTAA